MTHYRYSDVTTLSRSLINVCTTDVVYIVSYKPPTVVGSSWHFYSPNPEFINTEEMITDIKIHEDKEVWEETGYRLVTIQLIIDDLQEI